MKSGQRVLLVCRVGDEAHLLGEPIWPPTGSIGVVTASTDEYGEVDVMFDDYPCPVSLPDESWVVPGSYLIPIDDHIQVTERQAVLVA